jgi:hypothetical protein
VLFSVFVLSPSSLFAIELKNMGSISVVVPNESDKERYRGNYIGLSQVLLRLSGNKEVLETEVAKELLKDSSRYLLQYSYDTLQSNSKNESLIEDYVSRGLLSDSTDGAQSKAKVLSLKFDQLLLVKKLQAGGVSVWDANRPEVMFWWVTEENGVRTMVSDGESSKSRAALVYFSEQRAVPIKLPLMDLQDRKRVTTSDVWGGYNEQLAQASTRYNLNTWVSGKSYFANGNWNAHWEVHVLGGVRAFKSQSPSLFTLQKAVIASVARVLASEYAIIVGENGSTLLVSVNNVKTLSNFTTIETYLESLFVISNVEMYELQADKVTFKVILKEDVEKFKKLLAVDKKLYEETLTETSFSTADDTKSALKDLTLNSDADIDLNDSTKPDGTTTANKKGSNEDLSSSIFDLLEQKEAEPVLPHVQYRWYQN